MRFKLWQPTFYLLQDLDPQSQMIVIMGLGEAAGRCPSVFRSSHFSRKSVYLHLLIKNFWSLKSYIIYCFLKIHFRLAINAGWMWSGITCPKSLGHHYFTCHSVYIWSKPGPRKWGCKQKPTPVPLQETPLEEVLKYWLIGGSLTA